MCAAAPCEFKANAASAVIARREFFPAYTSHLMFLAMNWIMDDAIDSRTWNPIPWFVLIGHGQIVPRIDIRLLGGRRPQKQGLLPPSCAPGTHHDSEKETGGRRIQGDGHGQRDTARNHCQPVAPSFGENPHVPPVRGQEFQSPGRAEQHPFHYGARFWSDSGLNVYSDARSEFRQIGRAPATAQRFDEQHAGVHLAP